MSKSLDIYLGSDHVGELQRNEHGDLQFTYIEGWLKSATRRPLSLSLSLKEKTFEDRATRVWFANLLPEGRIREAIAKRYGINQVSEFAMLEAIGRDCAGAVSAWPHGEYEVRESKREIIKSTELAEIIQTHKLPLLLADMKEVRLSLAGAQEKLALIYDDNHFFLTKGAAASTHIIKPAIGDGLHDTVQNEVFCMQLAKRCGLTAAIANVVNLNSEVKVALIERFDRKRVGDEIVRIHQEDFCQALGLPPEFKYQAEGGPDLTRCAEAIRRWSIRPGYDLRAFIDWVIFNVFVGNCDAHAKNISFLFSDKGPLLAPFYDVLSTRIYEQLSNKLAMKVGGENRIDWLQERHWQRFSSDINVKPKLVFERIKRMKKMINVESVETVKNFDDSSIINKITEHIVNVTKSLD